MQFLKMKHLFSAFIVLFLSLPAQAQNIKLTSTLPDFQQFWSNAKGKDIAEQEKLWRQFEGKYAAVYEQILPSASTSAGKTQHTDKVRHLLNTLPATVDAVFQLYGKAAHFTQAQAARFKQHFPDMQDGMQVIYLPTLGINGAQRNVEAMGGEVLIIGVDRIAESGESLDVLFSHEFFHLYLSNKIRHLPSGATMASPLWHEGLATYVSKVMTPDSSPAQQLMQPELALACTADNVKIWAREYARVIRLEPAGKQYADWFRVVSEQPVKRRGYCLGLHASSLIATKHSLMEMTTWGEAQFLPKLEQALAELGR